MGSVNERDPEDLFVEVQQPLRLSRLVKTVVAAGLLAALIMAAISVNIGLLTLEPGPMKAAEELVKIDGAQTYPLEGSFFVTTVSLFEASLYRAIEGWIDPDIRVAPRSAYFPPGKTREEVLRETASQMDTSQFNATVAALRSLGHQLDEKGALVVKTIAGSPAEGVLEAGDTIVAVDSEGAVEMTRIVEMMGAREPGDRVNVTFVRDGETSSVEVVTEELEGRATIGIEVVQDYRFPFTVHIEDAGIGGPSAGLIFAVTIVDLLGPDALSAGELIAATGTIDPDGNVGAVGGIEQKMAAAVERGVAVFLVPQGELDAAKRAAAERPLRVIGVATLDEAIEALRKL